MTIPFYLPALLPVFLYGEIITGILSDVELGSLFLSLTLAALLLALPASTVRVSINKILLGFVIGGGFLRLSGSQPVQR
ncbi:hypothetical protein [Nitrosomonas mobilis]|uniref:Uncharacterized protein n=1 Tax=Nitrosomonas mobilis TaxID=51642 RepID=A0A1G5SII8_9PROT|nr:hypothetical protein [Nitrosomonas mobilis]SCZ86797.1 hypothetical protein NSMM_80015 [Nitrosomonas mobilis]